MSYFCILWILEGPTHPINIVGCAMEWPRNTIMHNLFKIPILIIKSREETSILYNGFKYTPHWAIENPCM